MYLWYGIQDVSDKCVYFQLIPFQIYIFTRIQY